MNLKSYREIHLLKPRLDENLVYPSNYISTCKYTFISFLPNDLLQQFSRPEILWFLIVSIFQTIPLNLSPLASWGTLTPLCLIIVVSMLKDIYHSYNHFKSDKEINQRITQVIMDENSGLLQVYWENIMVGSIIKLQQDEPIPADIILLSTSEEDGTAYVEISNLDGENTYQKKHALKDTAVMFAGNFDDIEEKIKKLKDAKMKVEQPNSLLYRFEGQLKLEDFTHNITLSMQNMILRGSTLKNVKEVVGVVVYTGVDTKLMMNSRILKQRKQSKVVGMLNKFFWFVISELLLFALICTIVNIYYYYKYPSMKELYNVPETGFILSIFTFLILYNNLVPISLYVTLDFIKLMQAKLIEYDPNLFLHRRAMVKNSDLHEDLAQIEYIFSDKTGTLTKNKMEFKKCWINGETYGKSRVVSKTFKKKHNKFNFQDDRLLERMHLPEIHAFWVCVGICHTIKCDSQGTYQGISPDEEALVIAASCFDFSYRTNTYGLRELKIGNYSITFTYIGVNEFTSDRKRMSVVVEFFGMNYPPMIICKGSDCVMIPRMRPHRFLASAQESLLKFSKKGLRTLVYGRRILSKDELAEFKDKFSAANSSIGDKKVILEKIAEEFETNLEFIGITGVEDKVRKGVPKAVSLLQKAGIKLWLLTGDKKETAENVAYSSGFIPYSTEIIRLECVNIDEIELSLLRYILKYMYLIEEDISGMSIDELTAILENKKNEDFPLENRIEPCLLVSGSCLAIIFQKKKNLKYFSVLSAFCASVIMCRITPFQKAQVVKLVKSHFSYKPVTLSIGDGSNDIYMLQEADIGVGIMGKEGMQAANSSDYALCRFEHLPHLILAHGRWNNSRVSRVILLSFFKNFLLILPMFFYTFANWYSGNSLYDSLLIMSYNIFMTSIPVVILGCIDKDIDRNVLLENPELYNQTIFSEFLNWKKFFKWSLLSIICSIVLFVAAVFGSSYIIGYGFTESYSIVGTLAFMIAVFTSLIATMIMMYEWKMYFVASVLISNCLLILLIYLYEKFNIPSNDINGVINIIFSSPKLALLLFCTPAVNFGILFIWCPRKDFLIHTKMPTGNRVAPCDTLNISQNTLINRSEKYKINILSRRLMNFIRNPFKIFTSKHVDKIIKGVPDEKINNYKRNPYTLKFVNPNIEIIYSKHKSDRALTYVQRMLLLIFIGILLWTIYETAQGKTNEIYVIRFALLGAAFLAYFATKTKFFHNKFNLSLLILIISGLTIKTTLEFVYELDGSMSTATASIIIFIILRANTYQVVIIWSIFLLIYLSRIFSIYSKKLTPNSAVLLVLSYSIILIGITLISIYVGFAIETSSRLTYVMKKKCEAKYKCRNNMLSRLFPEFITEDIKKKKKIINKSNVTIMFCEIWNFEKICMNYSETALIEMLGKYTLMLDDLCEKQNIIKIETVNKTYVACSGLNTNNSDTGDGGIFESHALNVVKFALSILKKFEKYNWPDGEKINLRIGINTGYITCGVVGDHKPQFSLVGDTMNIASRMCSTIKQPNKIRISDTTYNIIQKEEFIFKEDLIMFKGRIGRVKTYFVESKRQKCNKKTSGITSIQVNDFINNTRKGHERHESNFQLIDNNARGGGLTRMETIFDIDLIKKEDFENAEDMNYLGENKDDILHFSEKIQWNVLVYYESNPQQAYRKDFCMRNYKNVRRGFVMSIFVNLLITGNYLTHFLILTNKSNTIELVCIIFRLIGIAVQLLIGMNLKIIIELRDYQWIMVFYYLIMCLIQIFSNFIKVELNYVLVLECMYMNVTVNHISGLLFGYILIVAIPELIMWMLLVNSRQINFFDEAFFIIFFIIINTAASWAREYYDRETYNLKIKAKAAIKRVDKLLIQMIPDHVYDRLLEGNTILDILDNITILYADICGFTSYSSSRSPEDIIVKLSNMFSAFEKLTIDMKCYKVHTIGDCFVALGLNSFDEKNHIEKTENVVKLALAMVDGIKHFKFSSNLQMRIGIHTGKIIAGIVGTKIVRYDIYGADVDIANMVESAGAQGKINVSEKTKDILESSNPGKYFFHTNKEVHHEASQRSLMTYFLTDPKTYMKAN